MKLLSLCALLAIFAQPCLGKEKKLSLTEFLKLAEANDPNLELIMADKERINFLLDLELPARQLLLQARSEYGLSVQDQENTNRHNGTLVKNFIETGTTASVGYTKNELADRAEEVQEFRLEQSLFRNFFGRNVRLQKSALEQEVERLKLQIIDTYENYVVDLGTLYLDYAQAYHNVLLAKEILAETVTLKNNVQKMKNNNIASLTDLNRAKLQVALRQEDVLAQQTAKETIGARLIARANLPQTRVEPDINSFDIFLPKIQTEGIAFEALRAGRIAELTEQVAQKELTLANRLNDPSVNLIAGYNIDQSSRFGTTINREEQLLGLQLEIPLGDSRSRALQQEASLAKTKAKILKRNEKRKAMQEFQTARIRMENAKKAMDINQQKVGLSKRVYEDDLKRFQYGNLDLDRLIEAKNAFSQSRYQLFSSTAAYYKLALRWLDLSDKLVEKKL